MELKRANEILKGTEPVDVRYNDETVWIKDVNLETGKVTISCRDNIEQVPASQLYEL